MTAFAAIFGQELRRRVLILPAALLLGFLPIVAASLGFERLGQGAAGLILSLLLGGLCAVVMGYGAFAGEAAAGRLGFFFSRPISWWSLWSARLSAAVVVTAATGLLTAIPFVMRGDERYPRVHLGSLWDPPGAIVALGWILLLIGLGHAVGTAYASRSKLVALDLALAGTWLWMLWSMRNTFLIGVGSLRGIDRDVLEHLHWPLAIALVVASAVQLRSARSDPQRGHRVFSATVWPLILGASLVLVGLGWIEGRRPPSDLEEVPFVAAAPAGDWVWLIGNRHGQNMPPYLVNTRTGAFLRTGFAPEPVFSRDGRHAAMVDYDDATHQLRLLDLVEPPAERMVSMAPGWQHLEFSPDGSRVLALQQGQTPPFSLSAHAMPTGAEIWRTTSVERALPVIAFPDPDHARIYRRKGRASLDIVAVALKDGAEQVTGRIDTEIAAATTVRASGDGRRLLVFEKAGDRWRGTLHDGETGRLLAPLSVGARRVDARFLSDGRIAVSEERADGATLLIFDADGNEPLRIALAAPDHLMLGPEPVAGRLLIGRYRASAGPDVVVVNLDDGTTRPEPGISLIGSYYFNDRGAPPPDPPPAGSPAASLVLTTEGKLARLDVETGARVILLGQAE